MASLVPVQVGGGGGPISVGFRAMVLLADEPVVHGMPPSRRRGLAGVSDCQPRCDDLLAGR